MERIQLCQSVLSNFFFSPRHLKHSLKYSCRRADVSTIIHIVSMRGVNGASRYVSAFGDIVELMNSPRPQGFKWTERTACFKRCPDLATGPENSSRRHERTVHIRVLVSFMVLVVQVEHLNST